MFELTGGGDFDRAPASGHPHDGAAYCMRCGQRLARESIAGRRDAFVCLNCGFLHEFRPRPCAGVLPIRDGRALLVRRDIEPRHGFWQVPGGFMEMGESVQEAAAREAREEANVELDPPSLELLTVVSAPRHSLVVVSFSGPTRSEGEAGHEVIEIGWFAPAEIPWRELAFDSTEAPLREWLRRQGIEPPAAWFTNWES